MAAAEPQRTLALFKPGQHLGPSEWLTVTQEMITGFGDATRDQDPMHMDPAWGAAGPFGSTIAFGFLTLSLLTHLMHNAMGTSSDRYDPSHGYYLNYGLDRVRLVTPVPVGSNIRGRFTVLEIRADAKERQIVKFAASIELEGNERPALVAEWLTVWVPPARS